MTANPVPAAQQLRATSSLPALTVAAYPPERRRLLVGALLFALIARSHRCLPTEAGRENSRNAGLSAQRSPNGHAGSDRFDKCDLQDVTADMNRLLGETTGAFRDQFTNRRSSTANS